jgi:hypothetical protein
MGLLLSWLLTGCIVTGFLGVACASGPTSQPAENLPGQTAKPTGSTAPVSPAPPPAVPAQPAPPDPVSTPAPPNPNPGVSDSINAAALISRQASQLTLAIDDMGTGWTRGNAVAPAVQQVTSSSHVYYTQGSSYAPGVQNSVAVYRSIAVANSAYAKEKEANQVALNPNIGDECLLNDSVPINKLLVFRKNNVVVWLWLKQYKEGDIERYARIVEQRISASASLPVSPGPSSSIPSTPSQPLPAELPASPFPSLVKPADGLITRQAYQMVLTMEDMGIGWIKGNVSPPATRDTLSSSQVAYSQGANFAPTVQNSAVVYRNMQAAVKACAAARPSGPSLSNPAIGDECFLNDSVPIDRLLVFRKGNVVVWIWLKQYKSGDIVGYARAVEKKIGF